MFVIVVEHDMEFVREYADKVTVLHEGRLLDEEICINSAKSKVMEVYLGRGGEGCA